ncbi:ParB/RepB/Spo0J family partition protein [Kitasatospora cineracea]
MTAKTATATAKTTSKTLRLNQIEANPNQPRDYFDEEKMKELIASVKEYGVISPVEVRPIGAGKYQLILGERRYRAAHKAGLTTIPARIIGIESEIKAFRRAVAENVNRADMTPLEEGAAFRRIITEDRNDDGTELTTKDVAAMFGKTATYVKMRIQLLDLIPEMQHHLTKGHIGLAAAHRISELKVENQQAVLKKWTQGKNSEEAMSENDLLHFAHQVREQERQPSMFEVEELTDEQREERTAARKATRNLLDRIEQIRGELEEIAKMTPEKLDDLLGGQLGARIGQLDRVGKAIQDARFAMRQAKVHADAREIVVSTAGTAPNLAEEEPGADQTEAPSGEPEGTADLDAAFDSMMVEVIAEQAQSAEVEAVHTESVDEALEPVAV